MQSRQTYKAELQHCEMGMCSSGNNQIKVRQGHANSAGIQLVIRQKKNANSVGSAPTCAPYGIRGFSSYLIDGFLFAWCISVRVGVSAEQVTLGTINQSINSRQKFCSE